MMKKSATREYYEAILVAVILALFVRTFVFENFKIPSGSMENNLLVGDHLVVNKFIYSPHWKTPLDRLLPQREPHRGDVVVFKFPDDPRRDFIKRCIDPAPVGHSGEFLAVHSFQLYNKNCLKSSVTSFELTATIQLVAYIIDSKFPFIKFEKPKKKISFPRFGPHFYRPR